MSGSSIPKTKPIAVDSIPTHSDPIEEEHTGDKIRRHQAHVLDCAQRWALSPGLVPVELKGGALQSDAESERELGAMGLEVCAYSGKGLRFSQVLR